MSIVYFFIPILLLADVILSDQADRRPFSRSVQLEPSGHELLEYLPRVVLLRSSLDLPQSHISIPAERILILEGIVDVLEILERSRRMEVGGQVREDAVGQAADLGVVFGAVPGHVEEEEDVVVLVAVQAEDVAASFEAVLGEEPGEGLELDGGVDEEGVLFVEV